MGGERQQIQGSAQSQPLSDAGPNSPRSLDAMRSGGAVLTLPLNGEHFDQIKAGTKLEEYRLVTGFWSKRLVGRTYGHITLTRGYPKADDAERRLTLPWRGYAVKTITHPHFGAEPVEVFAINVARPA